MGNYNINSGATTQRMAPTRPPATKRRWRLMREIKTAIRRGLRDHAQLQRDNLNLMEW